MKRIILRGCLLLLLSPVSAFAQTQITENYLVSGPFTDFVAPMKFSYIVSDDGKRIKNGPMSISGKQDETYGNVRITGSYVLNTSAKNGEMNGPMSVRANYHGVKQLFRGQKVEDYTYSFSGSFTNGVPNGKFTAKATNYGSSSVTYKQGILVGAYSVDLYYGSRFVTINGNLNDAGKMVGIWNISRMGDKEVWEFVNGIRIRRSSKGQESTLKQIEMARKYAARTISDEQLEKEGYFPVRDSICLGDYAYDIYFIQYIADWNILPDYSFESAHWVKYTYLYNILPIPSDKFEEIVSSYEETCKPPSMYYTVGTDKLAKAYTISYYDSDVREKITRRFTDEQVERVHAALDKYCRNHPMESIYDLFSKLDIRIDSYKSDPREIKPLYERVLSIRGTNDALKECAELCSNYDKIDLEVQQQVKLLEKTQDGKYYILPQPDKYSDQLVFYYLPVSVIDDHNALGKDIKEHRLMLQKKAEEERIESIKKAEEAKIAREMAKREKRESAYQFINTWLSSIIKQSKKNVASQLGNMIVDMPKNYYASTPKNYLDITADELAEAISPVIDYTIRDFEEETSAYNTYRVIFDIKNKKEEVPVSMSVTDNGKIVFGSILIPDNVLEKVRKKSANKEKVSKAISKYIQF